MLLGIDPFFNQGLNLLIYHSLNNLSESMAIQDVFPKRIDDLPMFVHHIIIFEQMLSYIKVVSFHFSLGILDTPGD